MNTKQLLEVSLLTRLNLLLTNALMSVQTLRDEVATVEGANPVTQSLVETNLDALWKVLHDLKCGPFNRYRDFDVSDNPLRPNTVKGIDDYTSLTGGQRVVGDGDLDLLKSSLPPENGLVDFLRKPSLTERMVKHDARIALLLDAGKEELPKNPEIPFGGLFVKFDFDKFNAETDQKAKFQLLTDFYKSEIATVTDNVSGEFGEYEHGLYEKTTYRYFVELIANQFIELRAVDFEFDPFKLFAKEPSLPEEVVKSLEVSSDRLGETWIYNTSQVGMFSTMTDNMVDFALKLYKQQGRTDFVFSDIPVIHTLLYVSVADDCV